MHTQQTATYTHPNLWCLEHGDNLAGLQLHYQTMGTLNKARNNVVWVCHALTGNADFADWWPGLFGPGALYDPKDYFIICANMPGSCYGSTGPLSTDTTTGSAYFHDFPQLTNRDVAGAFDLLRRHLGIGRIHTLIGASLGGQQALEWAIERPAVFEHLVLVATNARHSAWGIAYNETQRMAISQDPTWAARHPSAGLQGLKTARAIAMLSYRHYNRYNATQLETDHEQTDGFRAAHYQQYQGQKLSQRFNAYSYWVLSKAMDSHNVGRDRGSVEAALQTVKAKTLVIGVPTDQLFPLVEQQFLAKHIPGAKLSTLDTDYGHDGFLVETSQVDRHITDFYANGPATLAALTLQKSTLSAMVG